MATDNSRWMDRREYDPENAPMAPPVLREPVVTLTEKLDKAGVLDAPAMIADLVKRLADLERRIAILEAGNERVSQGIQTA